jgi:hypothetical protein
MPHIVRFDLTKVLTIITLTINSEEELEDVRRNLLSKELPYRRGEISSEEVG